MREGADTRRQTTESLTFLTGTVKLGDVCPQDNLLFLSISLNITYLKFL